MCIRDSFNLVPDGETRRLLGVPFSADYADCAARAFATMTPAMISATLRWQPLSLNLMGRCHVAGACIASKAVFQGAFFPPTPAALKDMQTVINHFVAASDLPGEEVPFKGSLFPRFAVASLPAASGGMGLPVLGPHLAAMMAKSAWQCFRAPSRPWAQLFLGEAAKALAGGDCCRLGRTGS